MAQYDRILNARSDGYFRCDYYRFHAFWPTKLIAENPASGRPTRAEGLVSECSSCGTQRTEWIDTRTGELIRRWYDKPEDYPLITEDGQRIPINDVRRAQVRRMVKVKRGK